MAYDYDELYRNEASALGNPTPAFVRYFKGLPRGGLCVLDIGCGQGRDAIFIARLGHTVTGVDLSPAGVADLVKTAKSEDLPITGHVADIQKYNPEGLFDILLIDRTLHMLAEGERLNTLARLLRSAAADAHLLIADEHANMAGFRRIIASDPANWRITKDTKEFLFARMSG
jgi:SAM-dependent methyltransferase